MTAATGQQQAPTPIWWEGETAVWDPTHLTGAQRAGQACVVCHQRWPRPRVVVGIVPDGTPVATCRGCAPLLSPARVSVRGVVRATALLVDAGVASHTDLRAAVKAAAHHLPGEACASGGCRLCQAADLAVIEIAQHIERTEVLAGDPAPVDGDLERAICLLRVWRDSEAPPAAVVVEALRAVARELDRV